MSLCLNKNRKEQSFLLTEQTADYLSVVTPEEARRTYRNILEVRKLEDVQCHELMVVGYAYLSTYMSHRGVFYEDATLKLFL